MNWRFHMVWIIEKTCVSHIGISISLVAIRLLPQFNKIPLMLV